MKTCLGCKFACWTKTAAGKLHPSGEGECVYPYKLPPLPQSMRWLGGRPPEAWGGFINRRRELPDHCAYYVREG